MASNNSLSALAFVKSLDGDLTINEIRSELVAYMTKIDADYLALSDSLNIFSESINNLTLAFNAHTHHYTDIDNLAVSATKETTIKIQ